MGAIGLILALSLMIDNQGWIGTITLIDAKMAVLFLFVMSGFYAAELLNEEHGGPCGVRRFYLDRAARVYLPYIIVAAFFLFHSEQSRLFQVAQQSDFRSVLVDTSNLLVFPINWIWLLLPDPRYSPAMLWNPPVWVFGTELVFCAVAPLMITAGRRRFWLKLGLLLIVAYLISRLPDVLWRLALPLGGSAAINLIWFLLGAASYHVWRVLPLSQRSSRQIGAACLLLVMGWLAFNLIRYGRIPAFYQPFGDPADPETAIKLTDELHWMRRDAQLMYVAFAAMLPFLHQFSGSWRIDRFFLGLSYALFISHWVTIRYIYSVDLYLDHFLIGFLCLAVAVWICVLAAVPELAVRMYVGNLREAWLSPRILSNGVILALMLALWILVGPVALKLIGTMSKLMTFAAIQDVSVFDNRTHTVDLQVSMVDGSTLLDDRSDKFGTIYRDFTVGEDRKIHVVSVDVRPGSAHLSQILMHYLGANPRTYYANIDMTKMRLSQSVGFVTMKALEEGWYRIMLAGANYDGATLRIQIYPCQGQPADTGSLYIRAARLDP